MGDILVPLPKLKMACKTWMCLLHSIVYEGRIISHAWIEGVSMAPAMLYFGAALASLASTATKFNESPPSDAAPSARQVHLIFPEAIRASLEPSGAPHQGSNDSEDGRMKCSPALPAGAPRVSSCPDLNKDHRRRQDMLTDAENLPIKVCKAILQTTKMKVYRAKLEFSALVRGLREHVDSKSKLKQEEPAGTAPKSSKFKGVSWHKHSQKWYAYIQYNGKMHGLGYFHEQEEAAAAYDNEARRVSDIPVTF